MNRRANGLVVQLLMLAAVLPVVMAMGGGCGPDKDREAGLGSYTHLDPPELGAQGGVSRAGGVPVLCYHYFRSHFDPGYLSKVLGSVLLGMPALGPREFWTTPVGEFEKHLRYFRDSGTAVLTLDEVADLVRDGRPLPSAAVVLTIDDADVSFYELAYPLLQKHGMRAHLFVPTAHVGAPWSGLNICSWDQLREMAASGLVLVESHTRELHYKVRADGGLEPAFLNPDMIGADSRTRVLHELANRIRRTPGLALAPGIEADLAGPNAPVAADLLTSLLDIALGVGRPPAWLSWPYGFASDELDSLSVRAGYRGTVSLSPAAFSGADSTLQAGRFALTAKTTLQDLRTLLAGP
jgi:peptidoglycan/xylan/chitin deacetylase (PgdA/CDA1 family)